MENGKRENGGAYGGLRIFGGGKLFEYNIYSFEVFY
jgi:hypothetical protein